MHSSLQMEYFFRIISSTDESVILLPVKVCTKKILVLERIFVVFFFGVEAKGYLVFI